MTTATRPSTRQSSPAVFSSITFGYGFRYAVFTKVVLVGIWLMGLIEPALLPAVAWTQYAVIVGYFLLGRAGAASPFGFGAIYSGFVILAPASYVILLDRPLQPFINDSSVRPQTIELLFGSWTAIVAGICVASLFMRPLSEVQRDRSALSGIVPGPLDITAARVLLVAALSIRILTLVLFGRNSFLQQTSLTGISALEPAVTLALIVSAVLYAGATRSDSSVFRRADFVLFCAFGLASIAIGSRGELLAPIIILFLSRRNITKRTLIAGVAGIVGLLLAFVVVENTRSAAAAAAASTSIESVVLHPISSPTRVADHLVSFEAEPRNGSTYLWSLVYALPGPAGTAIGGPTHGTATLEYHEVIDFRGPGGLGFNVLAEPYLNFGRRIIGPAGFLTGLAINWLANVSARGTHLWRRSISLALVASVPALLRTDALAVLNTIALPTLFLFCLQKLLRRIE